MARLSRRVADGLLRYASFDARGLACFRIAYGLAIFVYLLTRMANHGVVDFHTNRGILPNYAAAFLEQNPYQWSLFFGFAHPLHAWIVFGLLLAAVASLTVGYRTRLCAIATLAGLISLHYRYVWLAGAATQIMQLLLVWTLLLPLGDRWSIDAWQRARRGEPERPLRVPSLASIGFRLNFAMIYWLNAVQKTGDAWQDGTAVHYLLWGERIATPLAVWLREREPFWFSPAASHGTLLVESLLPLLILSPVAGRTCRRIAAVLIVGLHAGIALLASLWPFPIGPWLAALLLLAHDDFGAVERWLERRLRRLPRVRDALLAHVEPLGRFPGPSRLRERVGVSLREAWYGVLIVVAAWLFLVDANPWLTSRLGKPAAPDWVTAIGRSLYMVQGWSMFAEMSARDGRLVVDMTLEDGTRVDPLTGKAPDFDAFEHGPWEMDFYWVAVHAQMVGSNDRTLWPHFLDYLERLPELRRWPGERRVRSIEVYRLIGSALPVDGRLPRPMLVKVAERHPRQGEPAERTDAP